MLIPLHKRYRLGSKTGDVVQVLVASDGQALVIEQMDLVGRDLQPQRLAGRGRVLLRPSGTEPVVRVMVEAKDLGMAQRCAEKMAATLR